MSLFMQCVSVCQLISSYYSLRESIHNSASHRCAQLLPCFGDTETHRQGLLGFRRRASYCYCASLDIPLFAVDRKCRPHDRQRELQYLMLWRVTPRPLWRNPKGLIQSRAEQDASAQWGTTCREQIICNRLFGGPPETMLLSKVEVPHSGSTAQTTLQVNTYNLTLRNQSRISVFPSKTQPVSQPITKR